MDKFRGWLKDIWAKINRFMKDVQLEMKKVSWPPRKEIVGSTAVVIFAVFVIAFFLGFADIILQKALGYIIK